MAAQHVQMSITAHLYCVEVKVIFLVGDEELVQAGGWDTPEGMKDMSQSPVSCKSQQKLSVTG